MIDINESHLRRLLHERDLAWGTIDALLLDTDRALATIAVANWIAYGGHR